MLVNIQFFLLAFSTRVAVAIIFFKFSPAEVPSATPQPQALQLDLRRVNERNQKVLSSAIHVVLSSLTKIGGVVCEMLLKAPHIYIRILDAKAILVSPVLIVYICFNALLLYTSW